MNGRTAKALRKVFKAEENPEGYKRFKKALRGSDSVARKKSMQVARNIVKSGKQIHVGAVDVRHA